MLREVAEYPNSFSPLGSQDERIETDRYTLCLGAGKTWNTVQRQRFALEEVDDVLAEVRAALRERGRPSTQWEVGSSAPAGLVDALLERGLVPDKDPYAVALVLTHEPPPIADGFVRQADPRRSRSWRPRARSSGRPSARPRPRSPRPERFFPNASATRPTCGTPSGSTASW